MYALNIILNFFLIINLCNFLKIKTKIETKKLFLISILILVIIFYALSFFLNVNIIYFLYISFSILFLFLNFYNKFVLNFKTVIFFGIFYFIFGYLSYERYFLDHDEFNYWGIVLKYFGYSLNESVLLDRVTNWENSFANLTKYIFKINPFYHPTGIPIFISITNYLNNFSENSSIFFSNLICLSGFFYLFFNKHEKYENLFKFLIFYLLINNLSFGLISIYVDPIIAIIFACILKEILSKKIDNLSTIILILSLLSIHRLGFLFAIYSLSYFFYINQKIKINKFYFIIIGAIFLSVIMNYSVIASLSIDYFLFKPADLISYLKKSLFIPIYFSSFGAWISTILQIANYSQTEIIYQINILLWFLIIIIFLIFSKLDKKVYLLFISTTIIHLLILFFEKINSTNYSLLVIARYVGLLYLSFLLFINSNLQYNYKSFAIIIIFLLSITPAKTFGLFVPQKIYLLSKDNYSFYENRKKINKIFSKYINNNKQIIIIESKNLKKNLSKEKRDFYLDILKYEIYPKKITILDDLNKQKLIKYLNENIFEFYSINLSEEEENNIKNILFQKNIKYKNIKLI